MLESIGVALRHNSQQIITNLKSTKLMTPYLTYNPIHKEFYARFVESRGTPEFQIKSKKEKENRKKISILIGSLMEEKINWRKQ